MSEKKGKKPDNSALPPGSGDDFWASVLGDALREAASRLKNPQPGKESAKPDPGTAGDSTIPEPFGHRPAASDTVPEDALTVPEASATVPEDGLTLPEASATVPEDGLPLPGASTPPGCPAARGGCC